MNETLGDLLMNVSGRLQKIRHTIRVTSQDLFELTSSFTELENMTDLGWFLLFFDSLSRDTQLIFIVRRPY